MPAAYVEGSCLVRFPGKQPCVCELWSCADGVTSFLQHWQGLILGGGWGPLRCCLLPSLLHGVSVLCLEMEYEASLPEKKSNTLSRDLIDYVRYMIQNHGENYKVSTGCPRERSTRSDSPLALLQDGNC